MGFTMGQGVYCKKTRAGMGIEHGVFERSDGTVELLGSIQGNVRGLDKDGNIVVEFSNGIQSFQKCAPSSLEGKERCDSRLQRLSALGYRIGQQVLAVLSDASSLVSYVSQYDVGRRGVRLEPGERGLIQASATDGKLEIWFERPDVLLHLDPTHFSLFEFKTRPCQVRR